MIVGQIADVSSQKNVLPAAIVRALEAVQKIDLGSVAAGRYELEGDKMFCLVQDVELRSFAESRAEAHMQYADIQIPFSCSERYGYSVAEPKLAPVDDQLAEKDLAFYPAPATESFLDVNPGTYLVFLPKELHRPCLAIKDKATIRKAVVKVHASLLGL